MMIRDVQIMKTLFHAENVEEFSDALNYLLHRTNDKHLRDHTHQVLQQALTEHLQRQTLTGHLDVFASIRTRICSLLQQQHPDCAL